MLRKNLIKLLMSKNKTNYILIATGLIMGVVSLINFSLNEDHVSLGIFTLAGLGFALMGFAAGYPTNTSRRLNKFAYTFLGASIVVLVFWFLHGKLEII